MDWAHPVLFRDEPAVLRCNPASVQVRTLQGGVLLALSRIPSIQNFPSEAAPFYTTDENLLAMASLHRARVPCSIDESPGHLEAYDDVCALTTCRGEVLAYFSIRRAVLDFERLSISIGSNQFAVKSEFAWFLLAYLQNTGECVLEQLGTEAPWDSNEQPIASSPVAVEQPQRFRQALERSSCEAPAFLQNAFQSIALRSAAPVRLPQSVLEECAGHLLGPRVFYKLGAGGRERRIQLCFSIVSGRLFYQAAGPRIRVRRVRAIGKPRYFRLAGDYLFALRFNTVTVYQTGDFLHAICRALAVLGKAVS